MVLSLEQGDLTEVRVRLVLQVSESDGVTELVESFPCLNCNTRQDCHTGNTNKDRKQMKTDIQFSLCCLVIF